MAWNIRDARVRVGLGPDDPTQDPILELAMGTALSIIENTLDRELMLERAKKEWVFPRGLPVFVRRYPIRRVWTAGVDGSSISYTPDGWDFQIHHDLGVLFSERFRGARKFVLDWTGGYPEDGLPPDLEWAMWQMFNTLYEEETGASSGGGGGSSTSGSLKQITLYGVGSLTYGSTTGSSGSASGTITGEMIYDPTSRLGGILESYKRKPL